MMSFEKPDGEGQIQISSYIKECKQRGITIIPPDLNNGNDMFVPIKNSIRFRLNMITDLGDTAYDALIKMRPIKSLQDLLDRREKSKIKDNVVENLIMAGCFDFENPNRNELMVELLKTKRNKTQVKLNVIPEVEYSDAIKSQWEKKSTGIYLSSSPLENKNNKDFDDYKNGETMFLWVLIDDITIRNDKNKNQMAFITASTEKKQMKVVAFKDAWKQYNEMIKVSQEPVFLTGRKDGDGMILQKVEV